MGHIPVLFNEVITAFNLKPGDFAVDGTVDGGGHAVQLAKAVGKSGTFLGVELDKVLLDRCEKRLGKEIDLPDRPKIFLVQGSYADLPDILKEKNLPKADGLLIDLGFSLYHIEESGRGFSFLKDEPLDMRYSVQPGKITAAEIVNEWSRDKLAEIFREYGEEPRAERVADAIARERNRSPIITSGRLAEVVSGAIFSGRSYRARHPATRIFQALRISVNEELLNVRRVTRSLPNIVALGGRVAIISFHSLEDRIVKLEMRDLKRKGFLATSGKVVRPSISEIRSNPKARSAKLRIAKIL